MSNLKNLTGMTFNRLYVIKRVSNDKSGGARWLCKCECGTVKVILGKHLLSRKIQSCGCLQRERTTKHGMYRTRLYSEWRSMINRCLYNENYINRITVCDEWKNDFSSFYDWSMNNGYSDNLTLDRIDNYGDYEPSNCRWVDNIVQQNNKRTNHILTLNGESHTVAEWSRILNINASTLYNRISKGKSVEEILSVSKGVNQYV